MSSIQNAGAAAASAPPRRHGDADAARRAVRSMADIVRGENETGVCVVVHGESGAGKTFLASTLPPDRTHYVNVEGGQDAIAHWPCDFISDVAPDLGNWRDVMALAVTMKRSERPFLVVDHLSNLEKRMFNALKNARGKEYADVREHGDMGEKEMEFHQQLADARRNGVNVVLLAHTSRSLKGLTGCAWPLLQPRASMNLVGLADAVGYLMVDAAGQRVLQWAKGPDVMAKSRYACLHDQELVPAGPSRYLRDVFARIYVERREAASGGGRARPEGAAAAVDDVPQQPQLPPQRVPASLPDQIGGDAAATARTEAKPEMKPETKPEAKGERQAKATK